MSIQAGTHAIFAPARIAYVDAFGTAHTANVRLYRNFLV
jgi:hypothetical protein